MTLLAITLTTLITVTIVAGFLGVLALQRVDRAVELAFHDWHLDDDEGEALDTFAGMRVVVSPELGHRDTIIV